MPLSSQASRLRYFRLLGGHITDMLLLSRSCPLAQKYLAVHFFMNVYATGLSRGKPERQNATNSKLILLGVSLDACVFANDDCFAQKKPRVISVVFLGVREKRHADSK